MKAINVLLSLALLAAAHLLSLHLKKHGVSPAVEPANKLSKAQAPEEPPPASGRAVIEI